MKIERTSIYNIYGITSKEKELLYNALHYSFRKGFGESDQSNKDLTTLMKKFEPTEDSPLMSRENENSAIEAALGD